MTDELKYYLYRNPVIKKNLNRLCDFILGAEFDTGLTGEEEKAEMRKLIDEMYHSMIINQEKI